MRHIFTLVALFPLISCSEPTEPAGDPTGSTTEMVGDLAVTANNWVARAEMPEQRTSFAAASVTNGAGQSIIYTVAGVRPDGLRMGTVQAYNVSTNRWSKKANLPVAIHSTNGIGVIKGKLYISGGYGSNHDTRRTLYVYNPASNSWTRKADMPTWTYGGVTGVIGDKLYVLTSCEDGDGCDMDLSIAGRAFYRYDPATDQWTTLPNPAASHHDGVAGVIGQKLYVAGGWENASGPTGSLEVYDPATNQWSTRAPMGNPRWDATGAAVGGKLYVVSGWVQRSDGSTGLVPTLSVYNPATDTWVTRAPTPFPRIGVAAVRVVLNGQARLEVVGGAKPGSNVAYIP